MEIGITKHGMDRLKERINLPKDVLEHYVQEAWDNGVKPSELKGYAKKQAEDIAIRDNKKPLDVRIYNEYIFLFGKKKLITVLNVKDELRNYKSYIKK